MKSLNGFVLFRITVNFMFPAVSTNKIVFDQPGHTKTQVTFLSFERRKT